MQEEARIYISTTSIGASNMNAVDEWAERSGINHSVANYGDKSPNLVDF
jgi:hypothetical protein